MGLANAGSQSNGTCESMRLDRFTTMMNTPVSSRALVFGAEKTFEVLAWKKLFKSGAVATSASGRLKLPSRLSASRALSLPRAARDGTEDDVRAAGNALGKAITDVLLEVYDGLLEEIPEDQDAT
ncbi:hypothetical protein ABIA18_000036 [Sinorhizobium fredii]